MIYVLIVGIAVVILLQVYTLWRLPGAPVTVKDIKLPPALTEPFPEENPKPKEEKAKPKKRPRTMSEVMEEAESKSKEPRR